MKTYFISDTHFGAGTMQNPLDYERRVVRFLDSIINDCAELYLMGDIIDFWFEYRYVVPRGYTRFLGKIGEFTDRGIPVHWFTGNHDIWIKDYIPTETGAIVHHHAEIVEIQGKKMFLAHGDGLDDDRRSYKLMAGFFRNKWCQAAFAAIHPRWTVGLAHAWSKHSRLSQNEFPGYCGEDREHLILFAKRYLKDHDIDYFIFGHRHIMLDLMMSRRSRVLILGDWIHCFSYAVMEGGEISLETFEDSLSQGVPESERTGVSIAF